MPCRSPTVVFPLARQAGCAPADKPEVAAAAAAEPAAAAAAAEAPDDAAAAAAEPAAAEAAAEAPEEAALAAAEPAAAAAAAAQLHLESAHTHAMLRVDSVSKTMFSEAVKAQGSRLIRYSGLLTSKSHSCKSKFHPVSSNELVSAHAQLTTTKLKNFVSLGNCGLQVRVLSMKFGAVDSLRSTEARVLLSHQQTRQLQRQRQQQRPQRRLPKLRRRSAGQWWWHQRRRRRAR